MNKIQIVPLQKHYQMEKNTIDNKIINFINEHHVLNLSTSVNNMPYCAHCFYVFDEELNRFIFTSDIETKHAQQIIENTSVAIGIALETTMVGQIRGIQIIGNAIPLDGKEEIIASKIYLKKFPFAILKKTKMWSVEINYFKYTDNRLGFGKKIIWSKND